MTMQCCKLARIKKLKNYTADFNMNRMISAGDVYGAAAVSMRSLSWAVRRHLNCVIMGAPGGGKGTISKKLVQDYNFVHVSK